MEIFHVLGKSSSASSSAGLCLIRKNRLISDSSEADTDETTTDSENISTGKRRNKHSEEDDSGSMLN